MQGMESFTIISISLVCLSVTEKGPVHVQNNYEISFF